MNLTSKTLALKLQELGYAGEFEFEVEEATRLLQCTNLCCWTPSEKVQVKYPTVKNALDWLCDNVNKETLKLSSHLQGIDKLEFLIYSIEK